MRLRVCVLLMGLLATPAIPRVWNEARAADNNAGAGAPSSGPSWHIQRLLVPAEQPEDWPRDKTQRYLPMPADEFEARVAELRKPSSQSAEVAAARLVSAEYSATLAGTNLVDGEALWQFESHGKEKSVVLLDDCQLAITDPRWADSTQRPVLGNDQYGRLAVVVERSGKLRCGWSLRGRKDSAENLIFDLQVPASPISTLHLTLPADLVAQVDRGLANLDGEPQHGWQRWTIELGGNHRAKLQIGKRNANGGDRPLTLVQTSQVIELSQRGLDLTAEIKLNSVGGSLKRLSLEFDQPLSPVLAEIGGFELPISLTAGNAKDTTRAEIEFPEPLQGSEHRLRITAVAPITTAERWRLPMVHVPDAHWQEGDATLRVTAPLALDDLTCKGCRQIKVEPSAQEHAEETIGIQCFGDSPEIDVMVSRQRERIRLASGVSISLRANECAGRFLGDFTAVEGERFSLVAEVAPQWIIDNVESDVAGRIVDWSHEALPGRPGKLKLQLRTPLAPQHPLRLLVTGRRQRARLRNDCGRPVSKC